MLTTVDSLAQGQVGAGVWKSREDGMFGFRLTTYGFQNGAPGFPILIAGQGGVAANTISGTISVVIFGNTVGTGTFDGTRVTV